MNRIDVRTGAFSFPYYYSVDCFAQIMDRICALGADRIFIVTDPTVRELYVDRFARALSSHISVLVGTLSTVRESAKVLSELDRLGASALDGGLTRRSLVIGFGGGVPGNVAGLLAGLLFRGIRLVHIPTTLVGICDSVISLKQAINHGRFKNILGMYYPPTAVFADLRVLESLPEREIRSGLCESIKNALALVPQQIAELRTILGSGKCGIPDYLRLLEMALDAKQSAMCNDEKEQWTALALEYGHTVGHAIELAHIDGAATHPISHGEAVGIGMRVAGAIAYEMNLITAEVRFSHDELLDSACIPHCLPVGVTVPHIMSLVLRDNKRGLIELPHDCVAFVLLKDLGRPAMTGDRPLTPVPIKVMEHALGGLLQAHV